MRPGLHWAKGTEEAVSSCKADDIPVSYTFFPRHPQGPVCGSHILSRKQSGEGSQTCVVMTNPDFPQISQVQCLHCEDFDAVPFKLVAVGLGGFQEGHSCQPNGPRVTGWA